MKLLLDRQLDFIDPIGELVEASKFNSLNPKLYLSRGYHNTGHMLISKYDPRADNERNGVRD